MKYLSTRGQSEPRSFMQAVVEGLADDGGLLVPQVFPDLSKDLNRFKKLNFQELALEIFLPFIDGELDELTIKKLIEKSYTTFDSKEVTPVRQMGQVTLLELFHGPTLAFKDIALQFLGNLFESIVAQGDEPFNILGATSGDTGSAAIHSIRGRKGITIFMLHPLGKISPIQEKQMTTVLDDNVVNIAIEGTFDDAQGIVKEIFNDQEFKHQYKLGAVNSINWARVMAQIIYYFYVVFRFQDLHPNDPIAISVPTGNFGNIYAGYVARKMGLPINKLILATNENDILYRTIKSGTYKIKEVVATYSPSMDIQVSSNFERFLFDILGNDGQKVRRNMNALQANGEFSLNAEQLELAQEVFIPVRVDTAETFSVINRYLEKGTLLDPHSAVGVAAGEVSGFPKYISLATAHPAKFGEAVVKATGKEPPIPGALQGIMEKESKCEVVSNHSREVKKLIEKKLSKVR